MNDRLGRMLFRAVDRVSGERIADRLRQLEASQHWPRERLDELRAAKLARLLHHAKAHVPFYRDRLPAAAKDLSGLPALTKRDIAEAGDALLSSRPEERFRWDVTSGSTGSPLRFRKSLSAFGWHRAHGLRALGWFGVRPGEGQARVWGVPIRSADRRREWIKDLLLNRQRYSSFELDAPAISDKLRRMARQRPRYLYGYPSAIHALAEHLLRHGRDVLGGWRPAVVVTTAELLFDDQARDIAAAFEAPLSNEYGASEVTVLASTCPSGSLHLNDEAVICEFEPTDLVIEGRPAFRLVFTDLNNLSMPLIRYRIGDLGAPVDGPCACGRHLACLRMLGGREVDVLRTPDGRTIHGSIFSYLGKSVLIAGGVRNFRATQRAPDCVEVEIEKGPGFDPGCLERMRVEMASRAGSGLTVRFLEVERVEPEANGKLRYFVSRL